MAAPATAPAVTPPAISWTADPIAARILADLARNPPECIERRVEYGRTYDVIGEYVGERVDRLRAIERRYAHEAMLAHDAGDLTQLEEFWQADPARREGVLVPSWLRASSAVDRVIYERVSA